MFVLKICYKIAKLVEKISFLFHAFMYKKKNCTCMTNFHSFDYSILDFRYKFIQKTEREARYKKKSKVCQALNEISMQKSC